jgi:SAM-dependent methyltransferase
MVQTPQPMASGAGPSGERPRLKHNNDWHTAEFVGDWRVRDAARMERAVWLARLIDAVPFAADRPLRVLDVGGGYGAVSRAVLRAFPHASVTLHDYSEVMFDQAADYLAAEADRIAYARADLWDRSWATQVAGPFDLVVSALCIHNLMDMPVIAACYCEVRTVLRSGGVFLDYDHYDHIEDMDAHLRLFEQAGYSRIECLHYETPTAIVRATA